MTGEIARGGSFTSPFRGQLSGCSIIRPRIRTSLNNRRLREQRGAKWPVSILFPLLSLSLSFFYEVQVPLFSKIQLLLLADVFFFFFFFFFFFCSSCHYRVVKYTGTEAGSVTPALQNSDERTYSAVRNFLSLFLLFVRDGARSSPFLEIELRAQLIKMKAGQDSRCFEPSCCSVYQSRIDSSPFNCVRKR